MKTVSAWFAGIALLGVVVGPKAGALDLKVVDKDPPAQLETAIREKLRNKAIQLLNGGQPVYEFWLCAELPLQSKPASLANALDTLKQPVLLGAVSVPSDRRDYRDDELHAGVYTMRLALQPQDGNHLGTSEFAWFAALIPARLDPKPDGIADYKALVKASSKETATDHPRILSLRPASTDAGDLPKLVEPAPDHKSVRVKIPAKAAGETISLVFEIVYDGKAHK